MEQIDNVTLATAIFLLTSMVVGTVELIKRLFDKDYRTACIIAGAALVGGLAGALLFPIVGFSLGLVTGLGASGVVKIASKVG